MPSFAEGHHHHGAAVSAKKPRVRGLNAVRQAAASQLRRIADVAAKSLSQCVTEGPACCTSKLYRGMWEEQVVRGCSGVPDRGSATLSPGLRSARLVGRCVDCRL